MLEKLSNRNIRVWDKSKGKMIYSDEAANHESLIAIGLHGTAIAVDKDGFKRDGSVVAWNIDHNRFRMDCVGQVDKNSKMIYEFDIVLVDGNNMLVRYNPTIPGYGLSFMTGGTASFPSNTDQIEIVGNFFETPGLLS